MRPRTLLFIFLLGVSTACLAAEPDDDYTLNKPNGRWWNHASERDRLTFVNGMIEGIFLTGSYTCARTEVLNLSHKKANVDTVKDFDAFYDNQDNVVIPLQSAWIYFAGKAHGAPPAQLEKMLVDLRSILRKSK